MAELKEIIFVVEEDAEGGFTARALGESIFTEAATMDELRAAIRDALKCHLNTNPIKIGTLSAILAEVSGTTGIEKARLIEQL